MTEWIDCLIGERTCNEVEGEVEVGKGEISEHEVDKLIDEFDVEEDLAAYGVICLPNLFEMNKRIDSCEEGSIKPSPTLRYEFRNGILGRSVAFH